MAILMIDEWPVLDSGHDGDTTVMIM